VRLAVVVATMLGALGARADEQLRFPVERYQLSNGMVVILQPDHRVPDVLVSVAFQAGRYDDPPGRTGLARLARRLYFTGTRNIDMQRFGHLQSDMHILPSHVVGPVAWREAAIDLEGASILLERMLWVQSDWLSSPGETITEEGMRAAIAHPAWDEQNADTFERQWALLCAHFYPENHPLATTERRLAGISLEELRAFYRRYYIPSNAILAIGGDFDTAFVKPMIDRYFAGIPSPPPLSTALPPFELHSTESIALPGKVQFPYLVMAWRTPGWYEPGDAALDLLGGVLASQPQGRLWSSLVRDRGIADAVEATQHSGRGNSMFLIQARARAGHTAAELEGVILDELARLETVPPTDDEVERARAGLEVRERGELEQRRDRATTLREYERRFGDARRVLELAVTHHRGIAPVEVARQAHELWSHPHIAVRAEAP
jgi:zinc protease